jgi:hypothetical protein
MRIDRFGVRPPRRQRRVSRKRLGDGSLSEIVKARIRTFARLKGKTNGEADAFVQRFSGHFNARRVCNVRADADVPLSRLATHRRHKSLETLQGYVRSSEQWRKSPLRGLGF